MQSHFILCNYSSYVNNCIAGIIAKRVKMPKKKTEKTDIKEIFAANLKENRQKKRFTQEKLAEIADISLRYIAMLELGKNFPSGEMLEKLAKALDIEAFQLFYPLATLDGALFHLEQSILTKIEKMVSTTVKHSTPKDANTINELSVHEELQQFRQDIIQDIINAYDDKLQRSIVFNIENVVKMSVKQAVASELKNLRKK